MINIYKNNRKLFSSLTFTLVIRILCIVFLILLICFFLIGIIMTNKLTEQTNEQTILSFQKTEREINSLFHRANETSLQLFVSSEITEYMHLDELDNLGRTQALIALKKRMEEVNINQFDILCVIHENTKAAMLTQEEYLTFNNPIDISDQFNIDSSKVLYYDHISLNNLLSKYTIDTDFIYLSHNFVSSWANNKNDNEICTIFLGISQKRLSHTYAHIQDADNNVIIIDKNGRQISGKDVTKFGRPLPYYDVLLKNDSSFDYTLDGEKHRIISYPLKEFGWTIIHEVPKTIYLSSINQIKRIIIILFVLCILLIAVLCITQIRHIFQPFYALKKVMDNVAEGNLNSRFESKTDITEIKELGDDFNHMATNIQTYFEKEKQLIEQQNNLKMQALISQINPHFIHNTLNIIKWMAMIGGNDNIVGATQSLINILAPSFKNQRLTWTISEEYIFLNEYINILDIRFGGDVTLNLEVDKSLYPYRIPRFIVQPLIENSVTHGYTADKPFKVTVNFKETTLDSTDLPIAKLNDNLIPNNKYIHIHVSDNGIGMEQEKIISLLKTPSKTTSADIKRGIGLLNIKERLDLFYKDSYIFDVRSRVEQGMDIHIIFKP